MGWDGKSHPKPGMPAFAAIAWHAHGSSEKISTGHDESL